MFHYMYECINFYFCRDIKPANVLMDSDDTPVWMDFGSMGKARQEIRKASEARVLQVMNYYIY